MMNQVSILEIINRIDIINRIEIIFFALWILPLIKINWSKYGLSRWLIVAFLLVIYAEIAAQQGNFQEYQFGYNFFQIGEEPIWGTSDTNLSGLLISTALVLIAIHFVLSRILKKKPSQISSYRVELWQKMKQQKTTTLVSHFFSVVFILVVILIVLYHALIFLMILGLLLGRILSPYLMLSLIIIINLCHVERDKNTFTLPIACFVIWIHISFLFFHYHALELGRIDTRFYLGAKAYIEQEVEIENIHNWMSSQECIKQEFENFDSFDTDQESWEEIRKSLPAEISDLGKFSRSIILDCDPKLNFYQLTFIYPSWGDPWYLSFVFPPNSLQVVTSEWYREFESIHSGFYIYSQ